jgi:hypothetical protein
MAPLVSYRDRRPQQAARAQALGRRFLDRHATLRTNSQTLCHIQLLGFLRNVCDLVFGLVCLSAIGFQKVEGWTVPFA